MNRSKLPKIARWMTTGRCSALSAPMYFRSKCSRHLVVELDRGALPLAPDRVGDVEVDLRAVERAVLLVDGVGLAAPRRAPASAAPRRDPRSRPRRGTRRAASTASPCTAARSRAYTRCTSRSSRSTSSPICSSRHEAVRIVLRELADAGQPGQHARRFVAVQRRLLVEAERQIAVAAHLAGEDQHVPGAVHRLHRPSLRRRGVDEEHVLPVVLPVPGGLPQRLVEDERRLHLDVAGREQHARACNSASGCRASCPCSARTSRPAPTGGT